MNPHHPDQMAHEVCRLLDSAANDLPDHIQARLAVARNRALMRFDELARQGAITPAEATGTDGHAGWWHHLWTPAWSRVALTAIPAILLVLAALAGSLFNQERTVIQQADAYTEMLTADVPLSAYTDNGFAAHLRGGMMQTAAQSR